MGKVPVTISASHSCLEGMEIDGAGVHVVKVTGELREGWGRKPEGHRDNVGLNEEKGIAEHHARHRMERRDMVVDRRDQLLAEPLEVLEPERIDDGGGPAPPLIPHP